MKGFDRDKKKLLAQPIKCHKCGATGGTLVKVNGKYECPPGTRGEGL